MKREGREQDVDRGEAKESGVKEKGGGAGVGRVKREGRESKTWAEVRQRRVERRRRGRGGGVGRVKREGRESKTWTEVRQRRVERKRRGGRESEKGGGRESERRTEKMK